jgi:hypothetical protein
MTLFWQVFIPVFLTTMAGFWAGVVLERTKWENREKKRRALHREAQRYFKR